MPHRIALHLIAWILVLLSGCSSKWAMPDQDYQKKYSKPYPEDKTDKWLRMGKQMSDARHLRDKDGWYAKGGWSENPDAGLIELGVYQYHDPWQSTHFGISGLIGEDKIYGLPGLELGTRLQTPTRLAPFVGVGTYVNVLDVGINLLISEMQNDDDDCGCHDDDDIKWKSVFATAYPEVGLHYWVTPSLRLTGSAAYHFSTQGRDNDFLMLGVTFAHMNHPTQEVIDSYDEFEHREKLGLSEPNFVEMDGQTQTRQQNFQEMLNEYGPKDDRWELIQGKEEPTASREAPPFPSF